MSRLFQWLVSNNLQKMGWPRTKGTFRKRSYVDTRVVDICVQGAVQVFVGLGAGRPDIAARVLTDAIDNQWSEKSTAELLAFLTRESDMVAKNHPELPPWKATVEDHHMAESVSEIGWEQLGDPKLDIIFSSFGATGLMWGLNHHDLMGQAFDSEKATYESSVGDWVDAGLSIGNNYPWPTLDSFYESCEDLVTGFEAERPPLPREIPAMLAEAPELKRRLG